VGLSDYLTKLVRAKDLKAMLDKWMLAATERLAKNDGTGEGTEQPCLPIAIYTSRGQE